ncbi:MAG: DNA (cytosine-5-)-methyltransferase [Rhodothermales bacterium]|nr:DNA (cytosine-5-)-methyltransferase [Rhodothermales bacterium]
MDPQIQAKETLETAFGKFGRDYVARELDTSVRTLERWETGEIPRPKLLMHALNDLIRSDLVAVQREPSFEFIDLFAGIGGTRLGFERVGGRCVYTSEWDRFSQKTYRANFSLDHDIAGDITQVTDPTTQIPDHDILLAGFPCQPFSIAGVSKKRSLGRADGFACEAQGTLFFDIARILRDKRPAAFMLENVKNLKGHDKGRTFDVIKKTLEVDLGYQIHYRIIDAQHFVPQHRERIFIVGFREPTAFSWDDLDLPDLDSAPRLGSIFHPEDGSEKPRGDYTVGPKAKVNKKYTLSNKLWQYLKDYAAKHKAAGNGFGFGLVTPEKIARTLSARYYKDGSEILVSRGPRSNPRRLTPVECARLMGFGDDFEIPVSDTQAYKQFGNSVVVDVVEAVAKTMAPHVVTLKKNSEESEQIALVV